MPETCGRCGIGTSQNFAKALFQAVGLAPLEGDASGSWKRAARTALVVAFLLSLAAALSFTMYYLVSLAALWIPNSITIGYLIGTQWRERLLILPTSVVVGLAAVSFALTGLSGAVLSDRC